MEWSKDKGSREHAAECRIFISLHPDSGRFEVPGNERARLDRRDFLGRNSIMNGGILREGALKAAFCPYHPVHSLSQNTPSLWGKEDR